jgi:transcriptional regulator with XRE-family HTH domain
MSGVDKASISRYLNGVKMPNLKTAKHIADSCNVPIEIFVDPTIQEKYLKKVYLGGKNEDS